MSGPGQAAYPRAGFCPLGSPSVVFCPVPYSSTQVRVPTGVVVHRGVRLQFLVPLGNRIAPADKDVGRLATESWTTIWRGLCNSVSLAGPRTASDNRVSNHHPVGTLTGNSAYKDRH